MAKSVGPSMNSTAAHALVDCLKDRPVDLCDGHLRHGPFYFSTRSIVVRASSLQSHALADELENSVKIRTAMPRVRPINLAAGGRASYAAY
jgi:hypothetical protein